MEHFTEGEEKSGGHGGAVLATDEVRVEVFVVWAALRSQDWLPHDRDGNLRGTVVLEMGWVAER